MSPARPTVTLTVLAWLVALVAALALAPTAFGATQQAQITFSGVSPATTPPAFGIYNYSVDYAGAEVEPFTKGPKIGHCVNRTETAGSGPSILRSGADIQLVGPTGATLPEAERKRIEWLLLSSELSQANPSAGLTQGQEAGAHQSAIWQITDSDEANITPSNAAAATRASQLLAASVAGSINVDRGAGLAADGPVTCASTARTVTVTGAPLTTAILNITSANGTFAGGARTATIALNADGIGQASVSGAAGVVSIAGTSEVVDLVQVEKVPGQTAAQDFVFIMRKKVPVQVDVPFTACNSPGTTGPAPRPGGPAERPGDDSSINQGPSRTTVEIVKSAARQATAGAILTYRVTARNTGEIAARNLVMTDKLPRGQVLDRRSSGLSIEAGRLVWRIGKLAPGKQVSRVFQVRLLDSAVGRRCNGVAITGRNFDRSTAQVCVEVAARRPRPVIPAVTG